MWKVVDSECIGFGNSKPDFVAPLGSAATPDFVAPPVMLSGEIGVPVASDVGSFQDQTDDLRDSKYL